MENHLPHFQLEDPLEACLAHFDSDFDVDGYIEEVNALLATTPFMKKNRWLPKREILTLILEGRFVWDPGGFHVRCQIG